MHRFLCDDKPGPGDTRAAEQHAEMEYARARLHFGAARFAESATMFRAIALHHADLPVGISASQLYFASNRSRRVRSAEPMGSMEPQRTRPAR
jgi:hypothetical protein